MLKIIVNPEYKQLSGFVNDLPVNFAHSGEVIYSGRNTIKTFDIEGIHLNVKSFKKPHLINQVMYATFRPSKAKRSFLYAQKLKERGFHTPDPVGYLEVRKAGLLKSSFYVSIHEQFDGMMREFQCGEIKGREELLKQFALFTAHLHDQKILHLDYSSGNILYKKNGDTYTFYLVDLNRMNFDKFVDLDAACFTFRRLWGSDKMISFIVEEYAKARSLNVETCLRKTFEYRKQFWSAYNKHYPGVTPYID